MMDGKLCSRVFVGFLLGSVCSANAGTGLRQSVIIRKTNFGVITATLRCHAAGTVQNLAALFFASSLDAAAPPHHRHRRGNHQDLPFARDGAQ
eukprot:3655273-Prymnesium_polylepis.2